MNKYLDRVLSSQRSQKFNPLIWPFLIAMFIYGVGFSFLSGTAGVDKSSLHISMQEINPYATYIWGGLCIATVIMGLTFLLFNIPPAGRLSGLIGFMLWVFASWCWGLTGAWLLIGSVAFPNLYFWFWQYLSLSEFRREDAADKATLAAYNAGEYDDTNGGKELRETNRGVDTQ